MTCTVIRCDQRSPAWFAARAALLTASDAAAMLSRPKKNGEDPAGKAELRVRLALETLRGGPIKESSYQNDDMRRGIAREPDAVGAYEALTGEIVTPVGFLQHTSLRIGCSPDGLVGADGGLEVKCPKYTTHYAYLQQGTLPAEYAPQIMHSLLVTGLPWWDFVSYCPEFDGPSRVFLVRAFAAEFDLSAYALAVNFFLHEVEGVMQTIRAFNAQEISNAV